MMMTIVRKGEICNISNLSNRQSNTGVAFCVHVAIVNCAGTGDLFPRASQPTNVTNHQLPSAVNVQ